MTYDEGSDLWNFELDLSADKDYKFKLSKDKSQAGAWGLCSSNPAAQQLCINENPDAEGATFSVDTRGQYLLRAALNVFDKQKIDFSLNKIAFDALYFVGEYSFTNWNLGGDGFLPLDYDPDLKEWSILLEFTDEELQNHPDGMYKICPVNNWNGTCWGKCSEADGSGKLCVNKSADGNANLKVPESGTYIMKIKGTAIDPYYLSYELTRVVDFVLCTAAVPARSSTDKKYNSCDIICSFLELCIFYGLEYGSFFSVGFAFNLFCVGNVSLQLG